MAILPSPTQVARSNLVTYEGFYQQVDPGGTDSIPAIEAAAFLKRSGLSDAILSKIWDMSDPQGKGFLDKRGFFVALKLIALAQNGKDLIMANIAVDVPPPQMKVQSGRNSPAIDWTIKPSERKKYEEMFYSMAPINNKLPGDKVKPVMLNSKLPVDILGKIWDLSDTDQDGFLSKEEFILAMHLVYKALEGIPVPSTLPPEFLLLVRKKSIPGMVPVLPDVLPPVVPIAPVVDNVAVNRIRRSSTPSTDLLTKTQTWIISAADKAKYDEIFRVLDTDGDNLVTGPDIRDTLLKSGLSQQVLAHIWNLCDIKQNGKLNSEQFALAMYLVQQKLQGIELPAVLYPEMIPPTLRPKPPSDVVPDPAPLILPGDIELSGNKELDMISNEIKDLQMEKMSLEKDLAQKEADVKIKNGELKNLQNELDALETMLKQLEIQKGEARKRLNDLDKQKNSVDLTLSELNAKTEDDLEQIEAMKKQKDEQEVNLEQQEEELKAKRTEVEELRKEESKLEFEISNGKSQLDSIISVLQGTQLQISQLKLKIDHIQEQHRMMTDAITKMDVALNSNDCSGISDFILNGFPSIDAAEFNHFSPDMDKNFPNEVPSTIPADIQEDPFKNKDPFKELNGFVTDPFAGEDPFKSDPFKDAVVPNDPFAADPFQEPFSAPQNNIKEDPFQEGDPFGSFATNNKPKNDPFDPFGLSGTKVSQSPVTELPNADPFGADPFGPSAHHAAPPRPPSPTPALPPKKSKAPPPRPAPPKISTAATSLSSTTTAPSKPAPMRAAPAPPIAIAAAADPFKALDSELAASNNSSAFPDLFSQPASKGHDAFDPFSGSSTTQDNFANFDNFADFDNIK